MAPPRRETPDPLTYTRQGDSTVIRPQAQAVDTFVRAPVPLKSGLNDLVDSLTTIRPGLDRFLYQKAGEISDETRREAETKAMVSQAKDLREAVEKGEITPGASPLFQRVFSETLGKRDMLANAQVTLWNDWVSADNPHRNSTDPAQINAFLNERTKKLLEGKPADYVNGAMPALMQVRQQLVQRAVAENVQAVETKSEEALGQLMVERIRDGRTKGMTPTQIAASLSDDTLPFQFAGLKGPRANGIIAQAITSAAKTANDPSILQIGYADRPDIKNPGGSVKGVFTIPKFGEHAENTRTSILSHQYTMQARAEVASRRQKEAAGEAFMVDQIGRWKTDPTYELSTEDYQAAAKLGISPATLKAQQTAVMKPPKPDPVGRFQALSRIAEAIDGGRDARPDILAASEYLSGEQTLALIQKTTGGLESVINSDAYRTQALSINKMSDKLLKAVSPAEAEDIIRRSLNELRGYTADAYLEALEAGKGFVDRKELDKRIEARANQIVDRLKGNEPAQPAGQPGTTQQPGQAPQPGQKGAQAPQPKQPTSIANAIPTDTLVPVRPDAVGHNFPAPTKQNADGRTIITDWQLPTNALPPDMRDINFLRMNPWLATGPDNVPLWQKFDELYGTGATRFFLTNGPMQIGIVLDRYRKAAGEARKTVDQGRSQPKPKPEAQ